MSKPDSLYAPGPELRVRILISTLSLFEIGPDPKMI